MHSRQDAAQEGQQARQAGASNTLAKGKLERVTAPVGRERPSARHSRPSNPQQPSRGANLQPLRQLAVARQVRREPLLALDHVAERVLGRLAAAAAAGAAGRGASAGGSGRQSRRR